MIEDSTEVADLLLQMKDLRGNKMVGAVRFELTTF
jgi:hypothetical protein